MNRVLIPLAGVLLLAFLVLQFLLFARISRLERELALVRAAPAAEPADSITGAAIEPPPATAAKEDAPPAVDPLRPVPASPAAPRKAAERRDERTDATPVTRSDVRRIFGEMMKERQDRFDLKVVEVRDPLEVMKEKLQLSPSQILRIKEHRETRDAAVVELKNEKDPENGYERYREIEKDYQASVRAELDFNQQKRYDELRESGELMDFFGGGGNYTLKAGRARAVDK